MSRFFHGLAIFLMFVWTVAVLLDIAGSLLADPALMTALNGNIGAEESQPVLRAYWQAFWSPESERRAIIWGLPMTVFALIAVLNHPGRS